MKFKITLVAFLLGVCFLNAQNKEQRAEIIKSNNQEEVEQETFLNDETEITTESANRLDREVGDNELLNGEGTDAVSPYKVCELESLQISIEPT